jgi:hypothetical protein
MVPPPIAASVLLTSYSSRNAWAAAKIVLQLLVGECVDERPRPTARNLLWVFLKQVKVALIGHLRSEYTNRLRLHRRRRARAPSASACDSPACVDEPRQALTGRADAYAVPAVLLRGSGARAVSASLRIGASASDNLQFTCLSFHFQFIAWHSSFVSSFITDVEAVRICRTSFKSQRSYHISAFGSRPESCCSVSTPYYFSFVACVRVCAFYSDHFDFDCPSCAIIKFHCASLATCSKSARCFSFAFQGRGRPPFFACTFTS